MLVRTELIKPSSIRGRKGGKLAGVVLREGDEMEFDVRNHEVVIRKNVKVPKTRKEA